MSKTVLLFTTICMFYFIVNAGISPACTFNAITVKAETPYAVFQGTGFGMYGEPGAPKLPLVQNTYLVPPDADLSTLSVTIQDIQEEILEGTYEIAPALPLRKGNADALPWPADKQIVNDKDIAVYASDAFYPAHYFVGSRPGLLQEYKMVDVVLYPYKYNPVTKQLKRMSYGKVTINYAKTRIPPSFPYGIPSWYADQAREYCVNFDEGASWYPAPKKAKPGYAVITVSAIKTGSTKLKDFVASKEKRGFTVKVVDETEWGGGTGVTAAIKIRDWLKANYQKENFKYALMIGDPVSASGNVPMYRGGGGNGDLIFIDLAGTCDANKNGKLAELADYNSGDPDCKPEIGVGRIPDTDIANIDKVLAKMIRYENEPAADAQKWRNKYLAPAAPSDGQTPGNHLGNSMKEKFIDSCKWTIFRICNNKNPGNVEKTPCNKEVVLQSWNADNYAVCGWWTHGTAVDAQNLFDVAHAAKLKDDHPTFTYHVSCSNSDPSTRKNLAYAILLNGGMGSIGGTTLTVYDPGQTNFENSASNAGSCYKWSEGMVKYKLPTGDALNRWRALVPCTGQWASMYWGNFSIFVLYGDPSLGPYVYEGATGIDKTPNAIQRPTFAVQYAGSRIRYHIPALTSGTQRVSITLYTVKGSVVRNLVHEAKQPGNYSVEIKEVASGMYLCRMNVGDIGKTIRIFHK